MKGTGMAVRRVLTPLCAVCFRSGTRSRSGELGECCAHQLRGYRGDAVGAGVLYRSISRREDSSQVPAGLVDIRELGDGLALEHVSEIGINLGELHAPGEDSPNCGLRLVEMWNGDVA